MLALGVFYKMAPAFLDKRGEAMALSLSVIGDPAAEVTAGVGVTSDGFGPEEITVKSKKRNVAVTFSPLKLVLSSPGPGLPFNGFLELASKLHTKFSALFEGVAIDKVGAVVRQTFASDVRYRAKDEKPTAADMMGIRLSNVVEMRATAQDKAILQMLVVRPLPDGKIDVTLDAQKVEGASWSDVLEMPAHTVEMLNQMASKEAE